LEIALSKMKIGVGFAAGRARLLGNLSVPIIAAPWVMRTMAAPMRFFVA
jgi:hypothetical protein